MTNSNIQQTGVNEFKATRGNSAWTAHKMGNDWIVVNASRSTHMAAPKVFRSLAEVEANCKSFAGVAHLAANPLVAI